MAGPGKRQYVVKGTTFEVDERYEVKKGVGQGAYGLICAAKDTKTGDQVAIKKITNAFEDAVDCKRILREIRLLQHFSHENVLNLRDIMMPPPGKAEDWKDIYLVTELLDTDLHYIIHSKQALSDDHIQYFVYQILRGLKAVHSAKVLHRDLKPGNLLVNKNCDLKICDFGLARGVDSGSQALTEYVVTRWYRAPELLVQNRRYGAPVDLWSVGCILAELLGAKALFPGKDSLHQLKLIVERLGAPSDDEIAQIENPQAVHYVADLAARARADVAAARHPQPLLERGVSRGRRPVGVAAAVRPVEAPHRPRVPLAPVPRRLPQRAAARAPRPQDQHGLRDGRPAAEPREHPPPRVGRAAQVPPPPRQVIERDESP